MKEIATQKIKKTTYLIGMSFTYWTVHAAKNNTLESQNDHSILD